VSSEPRKRIRLAGLLALASLWLQARSLTYGTGRRGFDFLT
jgi:hypothetical protein